MPRKFQALGMILLLEPQAFGLPRPSGKAELPAQLIKAKSISLKLLLAQSDATIFLEKVDGEVVKGEGEERRATLELPADKDEIKLIAVWEPNNYTKITRPRTVKYKEGVITVDFLSPSEKEKDDIVVRFVPTPQQFVDAMCKLGKVGKDDIVYDIGCGDARMIITAIKGFSGKRGVGWKSTPNWSRCPRTRSRRPASENKIEIREGDVLKINDLSDATVVLLYMGDDINARLKPILKKTLKPGSRIVSHRFPDGRRLAAGSFEHVVATKGEYPGYEHDIHLWVIKGDEKK